MSLSVRLRHAVSGFDLDVSWDIGCELAVLFGYSGSGKSMTLQMIAGFTRPDEGRVVSGEEVLFDSARRVDTPVRARSFGYVTQACTLFPHMTVRRNIEYALKGYGRDECDERTEEMIEAFRLGHLAAKRPAELSGGEQQRAQLARAIAPQPRALLLDEPFSALDAPVRDEMREIVRQVAAEHGVPTVLVTHDLYEAYTMASKMVLYVDGRVVSAGSPCEVFSRPGSPEVERLLANERLFAL